MWTYVHIHACIKGVRAAGAHELQEKENSKYYFKSTNCHNIFHFTSIHLNLRICWLEDQIVNMTTSTSTFEKKVIGNREEIMWTNPPNQRWAVITTQSRVPGHLKERDGPTEAMLSVPMVLDKDVLSKGSFLSVSHYWQFKGQDITGISSQL